MQALPNKAFYAKLQQTYESLPSLDCGNCSGDCCVSPTMTAPEFVLMMQAACQLFTEQEFIAWLKKPVLEHLNYPGNHHCRFQDTDSGRCKVYPGRAMACRLFGHEALRHFENADMEFCAKEPGNRFALSKDHLENIFETIQTIHHNCDLYYGEPYFLMSLHLDAWIDFYYAPNLVTNRPSLASLRHFLDTELHLPPINHSGHTTLPGKLKTIDLLFHYINHGDKTQCLETLESLLNDFPSVGSYYHDEAKQILQMLQK
jgi:Fe-S-cluster containining protein